MPQPQPANPPVEQARELAVVGDGPGAGGSFVITQRYLHDLDAFHAQDLPGQEATFGRTKADSVELDDKRADAHIEAFDRMLANMYGASGDGVHDRLMDFTHPVSGAYYFTPSVETLNRIAPTPDRED